MSDALKILEELSPGFPSEADVLGARERYDGKRWRNAFIGSDDAAATHGGDADVEWLLAECPGSLTREQILAMPGADPATQNRRILIASLMWGYGTKGLRYPQRMADIAALLSDPSLDDRLGRCRDHLANADVRKAYATLTDIRGIRSAFFTKFLYFLGRSLDPGSDYPLILDTLVAESLAWLSGYRELVTLGSYWPRSDPDSYATYVGTMHGWARALSTSADVIECYLWHPPKAEFRAACRRAHGALQE